MEAFLVALASVWADSGFSALTGGHVIMIIVGLVLLYMAIGKGFEPIRDRTVWTGTIRRP